MDTISVKSLSPVAAKEWTAWLVKDINEHMRAQEIEEAEASISYLQAKLDKTNIAGMQQVFYQLIESETRTVMLANARKEYVFKNVDPAVVPQEKERAKTSSNSHRGNHGGMFGILLILTRAFVRSSQNGFGTEGPQG